MIPGVGTSAEDLVGAALNRPRSVAGDVGQVAGAAGGALRDERNVEDTAARMRDFLALQRQQQQAGQTETRDAQAMQRAQLGIDAPMARTRQAAYGDALKNVRDVNLDFQASTGAVPKFNITGGLRPSMFGETARAAGGELGTQALAALMSKSDVPAASALTDLPELSQPKKSGILEKVTGGVGLGGSILDALGPLLANLKKRQATAPATMRTPPISGITDPNIWKKVQF